MQIDSMFRLDSKVAIVTGGAGLYGKPISEALAEAGAFVIIASRDESKCRELATYLRSRGLKAAGMSLDLENENSIKSVTDTIIRNHGSIDILINNAVSRKGFNNLQDMSKDDWEAAQAVNSTGMMLITQAVVSHMCIQKSGSIINIGSIQGTVGPHFPVYAGTTMTSPVNYTYDKWAMVGFTKWLANYYGAFNIRANCISPGGYGPGVEETYGDNSFVKRYKELTPLGRFANDDDIKGPVVFLASAAAAYITGHNLLVDGGWTSW